MTFAASLAFELSAFVLALGSAREAAGAEDLGLTVELKPGQEIAFPVAIVGGHVAPGKARLLSRVPLGPTTARSWSASSSTIPRPMPT